MSVGGAVSAGSLLLWQGISFNFLGQFCTEVYKRITTTLKMGAFDSAGLSRSQQSSVPVAIYLARSSGNSCAKP